jgi:NAD(P)-dependent dehydrogenase (short-subunit alcohol dehydrogenase family)
MQASISTRTYAKQGRIGLITVGGGPNPFGQRRWIFFPIAKFKPKETQMAAALKIAVVTGGGSGIGKAAAMALAHEGHAIVLAGRGAERLVKTAQELPAPGEGAQHLAVPTDVTDPASVKALFAKVREKFGRLDLLFNNAGVFVPGAPIENVTWEQWNSVLSTNLTGAFLCTQEAFKMMKEQEPRGGRIINNGSISAHVPRPGSAAYTASKHGITGLTRSTSLDGRQYGIACGQIDVGNAATEPMERVRTGVPQANGTIAAEPTIDPAEVGRAIVYMASLPLDTNVQFMTLMATNMPYIGRG